MGTSTATGSAARLGDKVRGDCAVHGPNIEGTITSASGTVSFDNTFAAREGDQVTGSCGHTATILSGSGDVIIEGKQQARVGDPFGDSPYVGTIIEGSDNSNSNVA